VTRAPEIAERAITDPLAVWILFAFGSRRFFYRIFYRMIRYEALRSVAKQRAFLTKPQVRGIMRHAARPLNMAEIGLITPARVVITTSIDCLVGGFRGNDEVATRGHPEQNRRSAALLHCRWSGRRLSGHGLVTDATDLPLRNVTRWNRSHVFPQVKGLGSTRRHHGAWRCCNIKWKAGNEPDYF
jgi:hypothetical protein